MPFSADTGNTPLDDVAAESAPVKAPAVTARPWAEGGAEWTGPAQRDPFECGHSFLREEGTAAAFRVGLGVSVGPWRLGLHGHLKEGTGAPNFGITGQAEGDVLRWGRSRDWSFAFAVAAGASEAWWDFGAWVETSDEDPYALRVWDFRGELSAVLRWEPPRAVVVLPFARAGAAVALPFEEAVEPELVPWPEFVGGSIFVNLGVEFSFPR
jgi:hypothetical protein